MQARVDNWLLAHFPRPIVIMMSVIFHVVSMIAIVVSFGLLTLGVFSLGAWTLAFLGTDTVNINHDLFGPFPSLVALCVLSGSLFFGVRAMYKTIDEELPKREKKS